MKEPSKLRLGREDLLIEFAIVRQRKSVASVTRRSNASVEFNWSRNFRRFRVRSSGRRCVFKGIGFIIHYTGPVTKVASRNEVSELRDS